MRIRIINLAKWGMMIRSIIKLENRQHMQKDDLLKLDECKEEGNFLGSAGQYVGIKNRAKVSPKPGEI